MNITNKTIRRAISGVLLVALCISIAPAITFAKSDKEKKNNGQGYALGHLIAKGWNKVKKAEAQTPSVQSKAPVIYGITSPTVLSVNQEGTWTINAADPANQSLSYSVDWGDDGEMLKMAGESFVQTSTFSHTYARPGTYTVTFKVKNQSGKTSKTSTTVKVVGTGTPAPQAPVISGVLATSSKPTRGVITWTTDIRSDSRIWYGTSSPVDLTKSPKVGQLGLVSKHKVELTNLLPDTTYYVVVGSKTKAGALATSTQYSFKTPPKNNPQNPVITLVSGPTNVSEDEENTWSVSAYDPQNGPLSYSVDWGDSMNIMARSALFASDPVFVQTTTFSHIYDDPGTYTVTFTVKDQQGLTAVSSVQVTVNATTTPPDIVAPVIEDFSLSLNTSSTSVTADWETDEPATSKLYYSTSTPINLSTATSVGNGSLVEDHTLVVSDLATSTTYFFIVESSDEAGNTATSSVLSVTTLSGI